MSAVNIASTAVAASGVSEITASSSATVGDFSVKTTHTITITGTGTGKIEFAHLDGVYVEMDTLVSATMNTYVATGVTKIKITEDGTSNAIAYTISSI